jgi:chemotaxis protein methyltransferase CheR
LFKGTYFEAEGTRHRIKPEIRQMVRFAELNLAEEGYPSAAHGTAALDLILCRNVLLYFRPELSQEVVGRFHSALTPGGWLLLGPSDTRPGLLADFDMRASEGAVVYQRPADGPRSLVADGGRLPLPLRAEDEGVRISPRAPREEDLMLPRRSRKEEPLELSEVGQLAAQRRAIADDESIRLLPLARTAADGAESADDETNWRQPWRLARVSADEGQLDQAEAYCLQAIASARLRPEPYYLYGTLCQARGDDAASLGAFRKALYADPTFVPAMLAQAAIFRRGGVSARAQHALMRAQRMLEGRAAEELVLAEDGLTVGRLRDAVDQALSDAC